jgi:hypothetical protein
MSGNILTKEKKPSGSEKRSYRMGAGGKGGVGGVGQPELPECGFGLDGNFPGIDQNFIISLLYLYSVFIYV